MRKKLGLLDLRGLAAFRVLLAFETLAVLVYNIFLNGPNWLIYLSIFSAITVLFGYRTPYSTSALWLLLCVVVNSLSLASEPSVRLLLVMLFWAQLLPIGARYSLDYSMDRSPVNTTNLTSVASTIFKIQILVIVGWSLYALTIAGPEKNTASAMLQLAILFPAFVSIVPPSIYEVLSNMAKNTHKGQLRIYYDRDCGFCLKTCLIFRVFMLLGDTPIRPAQDSPEAFAIMREHNTWVVYDLDGASHIRWDAVLLLMRHSILFRPLGITLTAIGMGRWGSPLYSVIASSRHFWSKLSALLFPFRPVVRNYGVLPDYLSVVWLVFVLVFFFWPALSIYLNDLQFGPTIIAGLGLDQRW